MAVWFAVARSGLQEIAATGCAPVPVASSPSASAGLPENGGLDNVERMIEIGVVMEALKSLSHAKKAACQWSNAPRNALLVEGLTLPGW